MEICDAVTDGDMPLHGYTLLHPDAKLDRLGRPSFFEDAVRLVYCRAAERWAELNCANQNQDAWIRKLALQEARRLVSEIEARFVEAGKLEL